MWSYLEELEWSCADELLVESVSFPEIRLEYISLPRFSGDIAASATSGGVKELYSLYLCKANLD